MYQEGIILHNRFIKKTSLTDKTKCSYSYNRVNVYFCIYNVQRQKFKFIRCPSTQSMKYIFFLLFFVVAVNDYQTAKNINGELNKVVHLITVMMYTIH